MTTRIDAIAVVVPAHDEEDLLAACLASLEIAVLAVRGLVERVEVIVALDACSDGSAQIAAAAGVGTITLGARAVGAARSAGLDAALRSLAPIRPGRIWTAHTDADSVVPAHWLTHQLALARAGADAVVGTVRPDFADLSAEQVDAWWATHTAGEANGHVHGANLGLRADVLLAAGGFPASSAHEDVQLMAAVTSSGAQIVASDAAWVRTSGRAIARAPEGYATYLRSGLLDAARDRPRVPSREISLL